MHGRRRVQGRRGQSLRGMRITAKVWVERYETHGTHSQDQPRLPGSPGPAVACRDPALKRRGLGGEEFRKIFFPHPRRARLLLDLVRGLVMACWGPRSR